MYILDLNKNKILSTHEIPVYINKSTAMMIAVRMLVGSNEACETKNSTLLVLESFGCEIDGIDRFGILFRLLNSPIGVFADEFNPDFEMVGPYDLDLGTMGEFIVSTIGEA